MKSEWNTDRRKFMKVSAIGTMALMVGTIKADEPLMVNTPRRTNEITDVKRLFKKCGACSHTFYHILNREFKCLRDSEEKASDPLAGGMMLGYQCGMLWGSSLAVGAESFRRYGHDSKAIAAAINTTSRVMDSFVRRTKSVNCRDVTGCDLSKKTGMAKLLIKILLHGGMNNSICFRLADNWASEAVYTAKTGLGMETREYGQTLESCASKLVRIMGGTEEEAITVAGLSGGMGLQGHACGALGAAIWMNTLKWCRNHPGEVPPGYNKENRIRIIEAFYKQSGSQVLCKTITGKSFPCIEDHDQFLKAGGCDSIIKTLAREAVRIS